jgi:hypothetical protein
LLNTLPPTLPRMSVTCRKLPSFAMTQYSLVGYSM